MTNDFTSVANTMSASTPIVQLVCCKCTTCIWAGISQIVIAGFAVLSGCIALCKYFSDKNRMSPKLSLKFEDNDRFCVVSENDVEQGGKMQTFRLRLDNVGACPARECKVRIENVFIISDKERSEVRMGDSRSTLLRLHHEQMKWPLEINNGDGVELEICKIALSMVAEKGADTHGLAVVNDSAVIHVLNDLGVLIALLPHQTHIQIEVKVIAALFTPRTYVFELEWKGRSMAAIGTAASYLANFREAR